MFSKSTLPVFQHKHAKAIAFVILILNKAYGEFHHFKIGWALPTIRDYDLVFPGEQCPPYAKEVLQRLGLHGPHWAQHIG
jgi:hypothetical protein